MFNIKIEVDRMRIKLISIITSFVLLFSFIMPTTTLAMEENNVIFFDNNLEEISNFEDIDWDSISIEMVESNTIQPYVAGLVARLVVSGGKYVIQWGSKIFKKAPKSKVTSASSSFQTATYKTGSHTFKLTKTDMKHMLERHHPEFWDGSVKTKQTFYNPNLSVDDVKDIAMTIAKDNSKILAQKGTNATFQVEGTVGGVEYVLGITKGHINFIQNNRICRWLNWM